MHADIAICCAVFRKLVTKEKNYGDLNRTTHSTTHYNTEQPRTIPNNTTQNYIALHIITQNYPELFTIELRRTTHNAPCGPA